MAASILHLNGDGIIETVCLGHDNSFSVILTNDDGAVATTNYTMMTLVVGECLITSTNITGDSIRWSQTGYEVGEVWFQLGHDSIVEGRYPRCYLTVYSATDTDGIVWAALNLLAIGEVETE